MAYTFETDEKDSVLPALDPPSPIAPWHPFPDWNNHWSLANLLAKLVGLFLSLAPGGENGLGDWHWPHSHRHC